MTQICRRDWLWYCWGCSSTNLQLPHLASILLLLFSASLLWHWPSLSGITRFSKYWGRVLLEIASRLESAGPWGCWLLDSLRHQNAHASIARQSCCWGAPNLYTRLIVTNASICQILVVQQMMEPWGMRRALAFKVQRSSYIYCHNRAQLCQQVIGCMLSLPFSDISVSNRLGFCNICRPCKLCMPKAIKAESQRMMWVRAVSLCKPQYWESTCQEIRLTSPWRERMSLLYLQPRRNPLQLSSPANRCMTDPGWWGGSNPSGA